jgi:hypothetical protein
MSVPTAILGQDRKFTHANVLPQRRRSTHRLNQAILMQDGSAGLSGDDAPAFPVTEFCLGGFETFSIA